MAALPLNPWRPLYIVFTKCQRVCATGSKAGINGRVVVPEAGKKRGRLVLHKDPQKVTATLEYYLPRNTHHNVYVRGEVYLVGVKKDVRDKYIDAKTCE